jgi:hypothetical protein
LELLLEYSLQHLSVEQKTIFEMLAGVELVKAV